MRQSPKLHEIQRNMQPGSLSAHGFLGSDERNLADILSTDDSIVQSLGLSHETIAQRMRSLTEAGKTGFGSPIDVEDRFEVSVEEARGFIACPFQDHYRASKINTLLKNKRSGKHISWTDLNIHMIEKHGFYEGRNSHFRVDPTEIIEILEL